MLCLLVIANGWRDTWNEAEMTMARHYYITVEEHLDDDWSAWFDGLSITHDTDGTSTLAGLVRDQSALYGLIDKARDLGLTLVAVGHSAPLAHTDGPRV